MPRTLFSIESELEQITKQTDVAWHVWDQLNKRKAELQSAAKVVREEETMKTQPVESVPFQDTKPA